MNGSKETYVRLRGMGHQVGSYTRLYRGADHLLQTASVTFSESYKRFYFRDIQAFVLVRTIWWLVIALAFVLLGLFIAGIGAAAGDDDALLVLGIIGGVLVVIGSISLIGGPSCHCYVKTAVQTERLATLSRVRRANKVLAELRPFIEAAQNAQASSPPVPVPEPEVSSPAELPSQDQPPLA